MKRSTIGVSIVWLVIWQVACWGIGSELLLPSPISTMVALGHLVVTPAFYINILYTFYRVIIGVGISMVIGVLTAIGAYYIGWFEAFIKPLIIALKVTPVMAVIVLALLWFEATNIPIFTCFLMCYPIVYTNVLMGFKTVDKDLLEMAQVFKVSRGRVLKQIYRPHIKPYLEAALRLVVGLAWKVIIAAEVLAVPAYSMGYNLLSAKVYLETAELFAWVIVIIVLSTSCEKFIDYWMNRGGKLTYDRA
ncbi:MAG: ABC transporter permease [Cellulosilyticaceae bacterium]